MSPRTVDEAPATRTSNDPAPATLLERVSAILGAFSSSSHLTGAEIMESTRLPRTSTYRILEQLVEVGWLEREGNLHSLGRHLMYLGSLALDQDPLVKAAEPHLLRLQRSTGLVVHVAILDGADVVYLGKFGDVLERLAPIRAGYREPTEFSALGIALRDWSRSSKLRGSGAIGEVVDLPAGSNGMAGIAVPVRFSADSEGAISVYAQFQPFSFSRRTESVVKEAAKAIIRDFRASKRYPTRGS